MPRSRSTSRSLIKPQLKQTRCGSLGALQCGQRPQFARDSAMCDWRRRLRPRETFFFGTAMIDSPLALPWDRSRTNKSRTGQVAHGPARIRARRRGYDRRLFKNERASATADA